jgi:hypothetical protein
MLLLNAAQLVSSSASPEPVPSNQGPEGHLSGELQVLPYSNRIAGPRRKPKLCSRPIGPFDGILTLVIRSSGGTPIFDA